MNDWGMSVLSQYPVTVRGARKVRGALLCDTDKGLYLLQEYRGTESRLEEEAELLLYLAHNGMVQTDCIERTAEGLLMAKNEDGTVYVLKCWYSWPECSVSSMGDLTQAVSSLARLHVLMRRFRKEKAEARQANMEGEKSVLPLKNPGEDSRKLYSGEMLTLLDLYRKHNRELRRVRAYLAKKRQKSALEQLIQKSFSDMYAQAADVEQQLTVSDIGHLEERARKEEHLIHGAYHQHNVLIGSDQTAVVNFEQFRVGCQLADLYQFLRKIMEKHNWNQDLGKRLLHEYCRIMNLSGDELRLLGLMIAYPEKYWKQVNFYYNNNKSWISEKNIEKMKKAVEQYSVRTAFADLLMR